MSMAVEELSLSHLMEQIMLHVVLCIGQGVEHVFAVASIICYDGWCIHGDGAVMLLSHDLDRCGNMM